MELQIGGDDGHFADGDDEDGADDAQEAKDVVIAALVLPQVFEYKYQFDEEDRERHQAGQKHNLQVPIVPWPHRDLACDRVGLGRVLPRLGLDEAVPAADVDQGSLDQKPQRHEPDQGAER